MKNIKYFAALVVLFSPFLGLSFAQAKLFQNSYVSFQLPPNWGCELEGTEWVCVSKFVKKPKEKKEAIIILTAKERGPSDSYKAYTAHLKTPRNLVNSRGKKYASQIKQVKTRKINLHKWIDGIHLGSEVQHYYTRYLATVKGQIGILVTFSAHKDHYSKYANDFIRAIQSLKITASKDILAGPSKFGRREQDLYALPVGTVIEGDNIDDGMYAEGDSGGNGNTTRLLIGLLLVIAGGIGFYMLQKNKKKK